MTSNSRTTVNTGSLSTVPYKISGLEDINWGQPSIIHLINIPPSTYLVAGLYAASDSLPIDVELESEFQAWEAASNLDFNAFEQDLDDAEG
jgi:hypothetical protein